MPFAKRLISYLPLAALAGWALIAFFQGSLHLQTLLMGSGMLTIALGFAMYCLIPKGEPGSRFVATALDYVGVVQIVVACNLPA